jgi:hypothetical protein
MGKTPFPGVFFFMFCSYGSTKFAFQPCAMLVFLFTPPPPALEKMLYPILPACLLLLVLLVLAVIISVSIKNKMRAQR